MARGVKKKSGKGVGGSKKTTTSKKKASIKKESRSLKNTKKKSSGSSSSTSRKRRSSSGSTKTLRDASNLSMRLFGVPYQFTPLVDPRVTGISSEVGKNFTENILLEAPICTVIPGNPAFLPGQGKGRKMSTAQALLSASDAGSSIKAALGEGSTEKDMKLYDFQPAYNDYMQYVNALCRVGASFLHIGDGSDGLPSDKNSDFWNYDWRRYKWNNKAGRSMASRMSRVSSLFDEIDDKGGGYNESLVSLSKSYNYVQFYIDSEVSPDESLSNSTGASSFKGLLDQGSSTLKEVAFMANSGGIDSTTLAGFTEGVTSAMQGGVSAILGTNGIGTAVGRIINLGSEALKGNNLIIPDIYQNSEYSKSYSFTVHLKTPYGTRFGYFYDIFVPMMHLLALVMPRQQSANSFNSPFLLKAYVNNTFTCNLGIASSISIQKVSDSFSTSGLPSEVDVTIQINDLYSDLMMSPSSSPKMFVENTSLVEYLATTCGLDLTNPNISLKWKTILETYTNSILDIGNNISAGINTASYNILNKVLKSFIPY